MKYNNNAKTARTIHSLTLISLLAVPFNSVSASAVHMGSARHVTTIQTKQGKSIDAGVRIGRLTPKEARALRKEQLGISKLERHMNKDGTLSAAELRELFKKLEYAQNHINKLLRNNISMHSVTPPPARDTNITSSK